MPLQSFTVSDFHTGIVSDETIQSDGNSVMVDVDLTGKDGYVGANRTLTAMTEAAAPNNIDTTITCMEGFGVNTGIGIFYAIGSTKIFKYDAIAGGGWTKKNTNAKACQGYESLKTFGGYLYYTSDGFLGRTADGEAFVDDYKTLKIATQYDFRPMIVFAGQLCIGDGNYLGVLDAAGTFNDDALILDSNLTITSLAIMAGRLYIGTMDKNYLGQSAGSKMFVWDGAAATPDDAFDLQIGGVSAMIEFKNRLIVWGGSQGKMYEFNGATLDPLSSSINIGDRSFDGAYGYPFPNAVTKLNNVLYWGISVANQINSKPLKGVWSLSQRDSSKPLALVRSFSSSDGENLDVDSIYPRSAATDQLFISRDGGSAATIGIDATASGPTGDYSTGGYIETPRYEFPAEVQFAGISVNVKKPSGTEALVVSYDLDDTGSYTSLGTYTSSNYNQILYPEYSANCRYLKLKFAWTPQAYAVTPVYPKTIWLAGYTVYYKLYGKYYSRQFN